MATGTTAAQEQRWMADAAWASFNAMVAAGYGATREAQRMWEEWDRLERAATLADGDTLYWRQMAYGMCSDSECDQPIAHSCCVCGKRVCERHARHLMADNYECRDTPHFGEDR